jgi:hypothetical protein
MNSPLFIELYSVFKLNDCSLKDPKKYWLMLPSGKNGQNDHLRPEQKDHPLTGAN